MNQSHQIKGSGGVMLSVHDLGLKSSPVIILIHGWSQCHLSFELKRY